jgi:hypothetical protein
MHLTETDPTDMRAIGEGYRMSKNRERVSRHAVHLQYDILISTHDLRVDRVERGQIDRAPDCVVLPG